jgi:hypothetical protein
LRVNMIARRQLSGLILASALITLDGTATTVALPAIGGDLSTSIARLQWVANAPLLVLATLLLPAGTFADGYGRGPMIRLGLLIFIAASVASATAQTEFGMITARFAQGAGGALVLPACLAALRGAYTDTEKRNRVFGIWAAWTGAASAAGPLLAGALVDLISWRAVFIPSAAGGVVALLLLRHQIPMGSATRRVPIPGIATVALILLLGGGAYFLMHAPAAALAPTRLVWPVALAVVAAVVLLRDRNRHILFPRELLHARNCLPANATTFTFYFGMFGVSFLLVLYVQQVLRYSAFWAAIVLLPISVMLLFAERFGRITTLCGTRCVIGIGACAAAAGIGWMATAAHPLQFWAHMVVGTALFGLGTSLAASALTHAAVGAVPDTWAGAASGLNHAVVRVAGLVSIALLGTIAAPGVSDVVSAEGVQRAMVVCAAVVAVGGVWGSALMRDEEPGGLQPRATHCPQGSPVDAAASTHG